MQQHLPRSSSYFPWHYKDLSSSGEVRGSSVVTAAGALPSLQPPVLTSAMDLPLCQTDGRHQGILPPSVCVTVLEAAAGCKSTGITNEGGLRISYPCSHTSLGSPLVMPQSPRMTPSVLKIIILNKHGEAFQCLSHPWSFCNGQLHVLGSARNIYHFPTDAHYLQLLVLVCSPSFSLLITVPHSHDTWLHGICRSQSALVLLPSLTSMFESL